MESSLFEFAFSAHNPSSLKMELSPFQVCIQKSSVLEPDQSRLQKKGAKPGPS
jgi:hypothetical protein